MNDNENLLEYLSANSTNRSRDARCARVLLHHNATKKLTRPRHTHDPEKWCPVFGQDHAQKRGRRSAERRMPTIPRHTNKRRRLPMSRARQRATIGGAPAFRCYAAVLARANASAIGSAPVPAFPETRPDGRYPLRSVTSLPRSAETGLIAGRAVARSRPGAGCKPARRHRTRSASESALAKASLDERDSLM